MKLSFLRFALPFAALAFFAPGSALAQKNVAAPTGATVIPGGAFTTTLVIDKSGSYVLGGNRQMTNSVTAIEISAPDVTLDLGGFTLFGNGVNAGTLVLVKNVVDNVEVRNGTMSDAAHAFRADHGKGVRFVDVRFVNCSTAIVSDATQIVITRCQFKDTGFGVYAPTAVGVVVDESVFTGLNYALQVGLYSRISRTSLVSCVTGIKLGGYASVSDSYIAGGTTAIVAGVTNTFRNNEIMNNTTGIVHQSALTVLIGNRLANAVNVSGPAYVNGGGNTLQ